MSPWGHLLVGGCVAAALRCGGWSPRRAGLLLGSVLPDLDFLLLVPLVGRVRGHRTITHAPLFQLLVAWKLRRLGFWSVLLGQLLHSLADSLGEGNPPGVAWLWPIIWRRVHPRARV